MRILWKNLLVGLLIAVAVSYLAFLLGLPTWAIVISGIVVGTLAPDVVKRK